MQAASGPKKRNNFTGFARRNSGKKDFSGSRTSGGRGRRPFNHESRPQRRPHEHRAGGFSPFQLRLVQSILTAVLVDKKPLDKAYALYFAKVKLEPVEQGFIIRQVNNMFRRLSWYAYVAGLKRPSDFERHVNRLIIVYCAEQKWPLPELDAGEGFERTQIAKRMGQANNDVLLNQGCPVWLNEIGQKSLQDRWPAERLALSAEPRRFVRTNTLKTYRDTLASQLSEEGVVTRQVKGIATALEITSNSALFRTKAFHEGMFEQQDAGSQEIAPFCNVKPGMCVIDACAGAGGKTLHLAALMQGKGQLIALDTSERRLEDLKKRARRAGAFNIETRLIESTKVIKRLLNRADRVLIDAPCSGTGVLRRTPDSKWRDSTPYIQELLQVQRDLLERYSLMAKHGGEVTYSTCSILPQENELQVQAFLSKHPDFTLLEEKHLFPSEGFDGFYMARLLRAPLSPEEAADKAKRFTVKAEGAAEAEAEVKEESAAADIPVADIAAAPAKDPAAEQNAQPEAQSEAAEAAAAEPAVQETAAQADKADAATEADKPASPTAAEVWGKKAGK